MTEFATNLNQNQNILANIKIAAPCSADWNEMVGTERERFCGDCKLNVFDISTMSTSEAELFLAERAGSRVCVQYFQRHDGTILTDNCPKGLRALRDRGRKLLKLVSSIVSFVFSAAITSQLSCHAQKAGPDSLRGEPQIMLKGKPSVMGAADPKLLKERLLKNVEKLKSGSLKTENEKVALANAEIELAHSMNSCSDFKNASEQFAQAAKLLQPIKPQRQLYLNVLLNQASALRQENKVSEAETLEKKVKNLRDKN